MDLSKLLNRFVIVVLYISCTLPSKKQRFQNLLNKSKYSVPFGSVVPWVIFLSLSIWSSYFTFSSLPHPFFFMGLDMIYLRWYSRRVNQRKYFQINCSLEVLISSYFHRFNSMAVCTSIVCALFWILKRKKLYFSNRRNSLHPPKHLLQRRVSLCAICDLVNAEPLKAAKVGTVSKNL